MKLTKSKLKQLVKEAIIENNVVDFPSKREKPFGIPDLEPVLHDILKELEFRMESERLDGKDTKPIKTFYYAVNRYLDYIEEKGTNP